MSMGNGKKSAKTHSPYFDYNDKAMPMGIRMFVNIVCNRFNIDFRIYLSSKVHFVKFGFWRFF